MKIYNIDKIVEYVKENGLTVAVKVDEPLKLHTSFRIGGPVRAMFFPADTESMIGLCEVLREHDITPRILGRGSNILAEDKPLDIAVINTTRLCGIDVSGTNITADSGALLSKIAETVHAHSLTGFEFTHGIPGTLGGAVYMNAGAYGGEMKDVVFSTAAYSFDKGEYTLDAGGHEFAYRSSVFARESNVNDGSGNDNDGSRDIILSTVLHLSEGNKEAIGQKMSELAARRKESQPLDKPSAGSTFKRPEGGFAAQLIEQAGLKGFQIGGAQVSSKHSGFIVNTGGATYSDVMAVIEHVQETVLKQSGVKLELEVKIWNA